MGRGGHPSWSEDTKLMQLKLPKRNISYAVDFFNIIDVMIIVIIVALHFIHYKTNVSNVIHISYSSEGQTLIHGHVTFNSI